jgi:flagellar hook-associated protein 2
LFFLKGELAMATSIDPASMASQLATAYTQSARDQITARTEAAQRTSTALNTLRTALSTFDTALSSLSGSKGLRQFSAAFAGTSVGTATAGANAQPGTYSFHVEQLATTHQVAFEDLPAVPVALGGPLAVQLADGSSFNVNLVAADTDSDGSISQAEIARAINQAQGNQGKVTASVVTANGQTSLMLSAGASGASNAITLNTSQLPAGALKAALDGGTELVAARDAVVWLGGQGGLRLQQASNTFTAIQGVSVTFDRAMAPGDAAATLTVAADTSSTAANVQKFVDAFNTLKKSLDDLTKVGNPDAGTSSAAFATDAGVRAMRSRLNTIIRQEFDGLTLNDLGIKAERSGALSLDQSKLEKTLAADPEALDKVFGKARAVGGSGVLGALDSYVDVWLKSGSGQIAGRQNSLQSIQENLRTRQARLDEQYQNYYERYLKQFTQLQALQAQMGQTSGLFGTLGTS